MSGSRVILPFTDRIYDDKSIFTSLVVHYAEQYKLYCSIGDITNYQ
jgi:hypothetical protein